MKKKFLTMVGVVIVMFIIFTLTVFADGIRLDGKFDDWDDKPFLTDTIGDEEERKDITQVKWFSDVEEMRIYFYCEREKGYGDEYKKKFEDWNLTVDIEGQLGKRTLYIRYHPPSKMVYVECVESGNRRCIVFKAHGKWGDDKYTAKRIEFFIPLNFLTCSIPGGYEVDFSFQSGSDRVPDKGSITVSTISTFPVYSAPALAFLVVGGIFVVTRKRRR